MLLNLGIPTCTASYVPYSLRDFQVNTDSFTLVFA